MPFAENTGAVTLRLDHLGDRQFAGLDIAGAAGPFEGARAATGSVHLLARVKPIS